MKTRLHFLKSNPQDQQTRLHFQKGAKQFQRIYQDLLNTFKKLGYIDQYQAVALVFNDEWSALQEGFILLRHD